MHGSILSGLDGFAKQETKNRECLLGNPGFLLIRR